MAHLTNSRNGLPPGAPIAWDLRAVLPNLARNKIDPDVCLGPSDFAVVDFDRLRRKFLGAPDGVPAHKANTPPDGGDSHTLVFAPTGASPVKTRRVVVAGGRVVAHEG